MRPMNGILNIRKEPGWTSHDVVAKLRRILGQKRIGHTGTLDPDAEGVLPVCLGKATRAADMLTDQTKTYEAVLLLGVETDTQDAGGKILDRREVVCTPEELSECVHSFLGEQLQIPPMYSALKKDGKKLYELAREGKTVEREPRKVRFYEITLLETDLPRAKIRVTCSKGTYIRTLCSDIGARLGCKACMEHLVRTRSGGFALEDSRTVSQVEALAEEGCLGEILYPVDWIFREYPAARTEPEADRAAKNGNLLQESQFRWEGNPPGAGTENLRLYDSAGVFLGLYRLQRGRKWIRPVKMFYDGQEQQT